MSRSPNRRSPMRWKQCCRDRHGVDRRTTVVVAFDYAFVDGAQGPMAHEEIERVLELADTRDIPVVV